MACYSLENKIAVITGAAQGIGLAIAETFLKKGVKTAILLDFNEVGSTTADILNSKYGSNKAVFFKCDVTKDLETISEIIFATYNAVDVLVNNAGISCESSIRKTMETNAIAVMEWSLKFLAHMKRNGSGTIINISSIYGFLTDQYFPIYKGSKFAVMGFSRTLGHLKNYNNTGVRVLTVCPGFTDTKLSDGNTVCLEGLANDWETHVTKATFQKPDAVGRATAEVFERAISGTAWFIEEDKEIVEIP